MRPDNNERRPNPRAEAASKSFGGDTHSLADNTVSHPRATRTWADLSLAERELYEVGYLAGEAVGYERGWAAADERAAELHRAAHRVVQAMVRLPERDREQDRAAARRRADRWGQPTFGGAA